MGLTATAASGQDVIFQLLILPNPRLSVKLSCQQGGELYFFYDISSTPKVL